MLFEFCQSAVYCAVETWLYSEMYARTARSITIQYASDIRKKTNLNTVCKYYIIGVDYIFNAE